MTHLGPTRTTFQLMPGMDVVFHVATAAPTAANAHNEALMRAVNIDGTQVRPVCLLGAS